MVKCYSHLRPAMQSDLCTRPWHNSQLKYQNFLISIQKKNISKRYFHFPREKILQLIQDAISDPVPAVESEDEEEKLKSRVVCSTNLIHQSDQVLRKLVATTLNTAKSKHHQLLFKFERNHNWENHIIPLITVRTLLTF